MTDKSQEPALLHTTILLGCNDADPPAMYNLFKGVFRRWESILELATLHCDELAATSSDLLCPKRRSLSTSSSSFAVPSTVGAPPPSGEQPPPPPSPQAVLFRLLLITGSVLPGTIPCAALHFKQQEPEQRSLPTMLFPYMPQQLRQDHALAARAYAQWWQWVDGMQNRRRHELLRQRMNARRAAQRNGPEPVAEDFCDSKFLLATLVKIASFLHFVVEKELQSVTDCKALTRAVAQRAQYALLAAMTKLPSAAALPHPFLLADLPGLAGAAGQMFTETASAGREKEFFEFVVQRVVQKPRSARAAANAGAATADGDLALQLKFLDEKEAEASADDDEHDDDDDKLPAAAGQRRDRPAAAAAAAAAAAPASSTAPMAQQKRQHQQQQEESTLWTQSTMRVLRFTAVPLRAAAQARESNFDHAISRCVDLNPAPDLLLRPRYEEPFAVRFILLSAQRMLSALGPPRRPPAPNHPAAAAERGGADVEPLTSVQLRLACRLCFWAAAAAATFPMDHTVTQRQRTGKPKTATPSSTGSSGAQLSPVSTVLAGGWSLSQAQSDLLALCDLEPLKPLIMLPVEAACLAMQCSLRAALQAQREAPPNGEAEPAAAAAPSVRGSSAAEETLLAVALAYKSCSDALSTSTVGAGTLERIVRTNLVADACKWVRAYPADRFRAELPDRSAALAAAPDEIRYFIDWKKTGSSSQRRTKLLDGSVVVSPSQQEAASKARGRFNFTVKNAKPAATPTAAAAQEQPSEAGEKRNAARERARLIDMLNAAEDQTLMTWIALELEACREL